MAQPTPAIFQRAGISQGWSLAATPIQSPDSSIRLSSNRNLISPTVTFFTLLTHWLFIIRTASLRFFFEQRLTGRKRVQRFDGAKLNQLNTQFGGKQLPRLVGPSKVAAIMQLVESHTRDLGARYGFIIRDMRQFGTDKIYSEDAFKLTLIRIITILGWTIVCLFSLKRRKPKSWHKRGSAKSNVRRVRRIRVLNTQD